MIGKRAVSPTDYLLCYLANVKQLSTLFNNEG